MAASAQAAATTITTNDSVESLDIKQLLAATFVPVRGCTQVVFAAHRGTTPCSRGVVQDMSRPETAANRSKSRKLRVAAAAFLIAELRS